MSLHELPEGWVWTTLGEVCERPKRPKIEPATAVGFVPMARAHTELFRMPDFETRTWAEVKSGFSTFANGDVLLARITPCFENGKGGIATGLPNGIGAGSTELMPFRPDRTRVTPEWIAAVFKQPRFLAEGAASMSGAVGQQRVPREWVESYEIPLPPLADQERIAAKLDAVFARASACRARLARVRELLQQLRRSVLTAAVTGELTRAWREERGVGLEGWREVKLGEVVREPLKNGKSVRDGTGGPVLRLSAVRDGRLDLSESKPGEWTDEEWSRVLVEEGDVFVVRGNGSIDLVGRPAMARGVDRPVAFPDTLIRVRPVLRLLSEEYLVLALESDPVRRQLETTARTSAGIWKVAQGDIERIELHLPPLSEQRAIVGAAAAAFANLSRISAGTSSTEDRIDRANSAALCAAFAGQL